MIQGLTCRAAFASSIRVPVIMSWPGERPGSSQSVLDYPWSSLSGGHALPPKSRAKWLDKEAALKAFELPDRAAGRRRMVERVDERDLKGSDIRKVTLARLVWKKTTASQEWIAKKLHMGSATNVSQQLRRLEKAGKSGKGKLPEALKAYIKSHDPI